MFSCNGGAHFVLDKTDDQISEVCACIRSHATEGVSISLH